MAEPVSTLLFSACVALLIWGALQGEGRRLTMGLVVGSTTAALVAMILPSVELAAVGFALGALVGAVFRGWSGGRGRGPRGLLGGGWSGRGGFGGGGGTASGRW